MSEDTGTTDIQVVSLYKFVALPDCADIREPLFDFCRQRQIYGTILLSPEGINGTISGSADATQQLIKYLEEDPRLRDIDCKFAKASSRPFLRLKVRLKKEIVTMGVPEVDPTSQRGLYVEPSDWNALINDPDVVVIDTRNDYEVALGQFPGAVNPRTKRFRDLPAWLEAQEILKSKPKVAMYCTGGIRCEKSTALLNAAGFDSVYHLKGGILKYLETVEADDNLFEGDCFVFDERVSVDKDLNQGCYVLCRGCRMPVSAKDQTREEFESGVSCHHCHATLSDEKRARLEERQRQSELAASRNTRHVGARYDV